VGRNAVEITSDAPRADFGGDTMLAAALITLSCSGNWLAPEPLSEHIRRPVSTSLVIDMDKQTVVGEGIGCHNNEPCPITQVTESYIRFTVLDAWSGELNRITGALTVAGNTEKNNASRTIYDLTCKPAKPLF
jgi:hypothetical protein